jgi:FixJ family two-component response regulator
MDPTVFVVDDDELARNSVCALVKSMGIRSQSFASAEDFLAAYQDRRPGCVVTDLRMPGMSGIDLQEQLIQRQIDIPVIVLTAYARTATTVRAMRAGALAVLDRPYAQDDLWEMLRKALSDDVARRTERELRHDLSVRLSQLTILERKVLDLVVAGHSNKGIAAALDISMRTVANRRSDIMDKMGASCTAELLRMAFEANATK